MRPGPDIGREKKITGLRPCRRRRATDPLAARAENFPRMRPPYVLAKNASPMLNHSFLRRASLGTLPLATLGPPTLLRAAAAPALTANPLLTESTLPSP